MDVPGGRGRRLQRGLDLQPGGVTTGVDDPGPGVAALEGVRQRPVRGAVEVGAVLYEVAHRGGTLLDEDPDRVGVAQACSGDEGVDEVVLGVVPGASAVATPPWAQRVLPSPRCSLVTTSTCRPWPLSVVASEPADPVPTTRTSAVVTNSTGPQASRSTTRGADSTRGAALGSLATSRW